MNTIIVTAFLFSGSIFLISWYFITTFQEKKLAENRFKQINRTSSAEKSELSATAAFFNKELRKKRIRTLQIRFSLIACFPLFFLWFALDPREPLLKMAIVALAVFVLRRFILAKLVTMRNLTMEEELPAMLDLLLICIDGGMSLNAALVRVAGEVKKSALAHEFRITFHELNAGVPQETAFRHLADRNQVQDVQALAASVVQSEKLGMSLGDTLRNQAKLLRETIRLRTREKIMKVPIKMLLPLALCILPAVLVVAGGPAFIQIYTQLLPGG